MTPFGNYPGQLTLLDLKKNHFFGHTALISIYIPLVPRPAPLTTQYGQEVGGCLRTPLIRGLKPTSCWASGDAGEGRVEATCPATASDWSRIHNLGSLTCLLVSSKSQIDLLDVDASLWFTSVRPSVSQLVS